MVRGCRGDVLHDNRGCFGDCYAKDASRRFRVLFNKPQRMEFRKDPLTRDVDRLGDEWVRSGVVGALAFAWNLPRDVTHFLDQWGITVVHLTRFWEEPDDLLLAELARYESIIYGSVSILDPPAIRNRILHNLDRYEEFGGRSVCRVVTVAVRDDSELWDLQADLMHLDSVLGQPLRFQGSNPFIDVFNLDICEPIPANTAGKPSHKWKSAGQLYPKRACVGHCWSCYHQCVGNVRCW